MKKIKIFLMQLMCEHYWRFLHVSESVNFHVPGDCTRPVRYYLSECRKCGAVNVERNFESEAQNG
jgi:hypothetical protein